jgi:predicted solute-binding protein
VLEAHPDLPEILKTCRDRGEKEIARIAAEAASDLPQSAIRVYLERRIRYRLGASEAAGLQAFLERARPFVEDKKTATCSTSGSSVNTPTG